MAFKSVLWLYSTEHSIEELYLSVDLFNGGGHKILHYDDTLCSRHRPRFTFCGRKKGGKTL